MKTQRTIFGLTPWAPALRVPGLGSGDESWRSRSSSDWSWDSELETERGDGPPKGCGFSQDDLGLERLNCGTQYMPGPAPGAGRRMPAGLGQAEAPLETPPSPCRGGNLATAAIVIALGGIAWYVFGK